MEYYASLNSLWSKLVKQRLIGFYPITGLLLLAQGILLFYGWGFAVALYHWPALLLSFVGILLLTNLIANLSFGTQWLAVVLNVLLFLTFNLLLGYHFSTGFPLDYQLVMDSLGNLEYGETIEMAVDFNWALGIRMAIMAGILFFLQKLTGIFTTKPSGGHYGKKVLFSLSGYALLIGLSPVQYDEASEFISSAYHYNFGGQYHNYEIPEGTQEYPYLHENETSGIKRFDSLPHIFFIILESCNAKFIETKSESGKEYMPFMNSLIKKGLYVEQFYSNSVYTTKGQLATLTGLLPSINKNVFIYHKDLRTQSLAEILKDNGYRTSFFQSYKDLGFADTDDFLATMDLDIVKQMDEEFITKDDYPYIWGWGLQDNLLYKKHFEYLDKDYVANREKMGDVQPYFSILSPVSHHYDFSRYPKDQAYIYPKASTYSQHFANSIHLEDKYLETFFVELEKRDYLKNSVVVVLGDHSFPSTGVNSDYIYHGFGENRFRVPLLMIAPGRIAPQRIKLAYSQMDIAPTILDFLDIKAQNHFTGKSILSNSQEQHCINLVQPYDGINIATLLFPYKYVRNERTGKEHLFDVKNDPEEKINLIDSKENEVVDILVKLKKGHEQAYFNQRLIEENRLWPPEE